MGSVCALGYKIFGWSIKMYVLKGTSKIYSCIIAPHMVSLSNRCLYWKPKGPLSLSLILALAIKIQKKKHRHRLWLMQAERDGIGVSSIGHERDVSKMGPHTNTRHYSTRRKDRWKGRGVESRTMLLISVRQIHMRREALARKEVCVGGVLLHLLGHLSTVTHPTAALGGHYNTVSSLILTRDRHCCRHTWQPWDQRKRRGAKC